MRMKKKKITHIHIYVYDILSPPTNEANDCTAQKMTKMKEIHQMWWAKTHESMWEMDVLIQAEWDWEQSEIERTYRKKKKQQTKSRLQIT